MTSPSLFSVLRTRGRAGIPGGFVEGMEECFPPDAELGILLSEVELQELLGRFEAILAYCRNCDQHGGMPSTETLRGMIGA